MRLYLERLAKLKKEIYLISSKSKKSKKKKFKHNQKIMIDFINSATDYAEFTVNSKKIFLRVGDEKKGFRHILEKHYCSGCPGEITAKEILNIIDIVERGIKLNEEGNTNSDLVVYQRMDTQHRLVLKPIDMDSLIITMYGLC